jgi:5'-methylthioadenosine phosphorylase
VIGVSGGSGFYQFLDDIELVEVDTPFGAPAAPIALGAVAGTQVAFLPRHGADHRFPPHAVPYRANVWALKELGCRAVLGPFAAGSLRRDVEPGHLVVVDQLVDRTWGRPDTFHDVFEHGPVHVEMGEPYDAALREAIVRGARELSFTVHDQGTVVVVQGPRFSTRAESRWFAANGWDVVNMTQHPEAVLAKEAGLPFAGVALVTDFDSGVEGVPHVTQAKVFETFEANIGRLRQLLFHIVPTLA